MTAYSLTAGPTAQWWNGTDGSIAGLSELTVANLSDGDDVIVSIYGEPASATCGFRIFPGESLKSASARAKHRAGAKPFALVGWRRAMPSRLPMRFARQRTQIRATPCRARTSQPAVAKNTGSASLLPTRDAPSAETRFRRLKGFKACRQARPTIDFSAFHRSSGAWLSRFLRNSKPVSAGAPLSGASASGVRIRRTRKLSRSQASCEKRQSRNAGAASRAFCDWRPGRPFVSFRRVPSMRVGYASAMQLPLATPGRSQPCRRPRRRVAMPCEHGMRQQFASGLLAPARR